MYCFKLKDGSILIPVRSETEGVVGDSLKRITKSDPNYDDWAKESVQAPSAVEMAFRKK